MVKTRVGFYSEENKKASLKRIRSDKKKLLECHNKIIACLESGGKIMHEISETTGLTISGVCGRIGELRDMELVKDSGKSKKSPFGIEVTIWELVNQMKLF